MQPRSGLTPLDTPCPSLPNEILLDIIRLSLPLDALNQWRQHSRLLRRYARVNRQWRTLAQAELFSTVHLTTKKQANGLATAYKSNPSLAHLCTSFKAMSSPFSDPAAPYAELAPLVALLKRVNLIWFDCIPGVVLWDLLAAPSLDSLLIRGGTLHAPLPSSSSLKPSTIRRLALCNNPYIERPFQIPIRLLPNLQSLNIAYSIGSFRSHRLRLSCRIICDLAIALGPQLTSLRVNAGGLQAVRKALPCLTSLQMLGTPVESAEQLQKTLQALARPIVGLYATVAKPSRTAANWCSTAYIFSQLFKAEALAPCFQRLKMVYVHGWPDRRDPFMSDLDYRVAYRGRKKGVLVSRMGAGVRWVWGGTKEEDITPWSFWSEAERLHLLEKCGRPYSSWAEGLRAKTVDD